MILRRPHPQRLTDPPNRIITVLLCLVVLSGVLYLTGLSSPRSIEVTLSPTLRILWGTCLTVGGISALAGQYWYGRIFTGARLKRAGLFMAGGGMVAYGLAVLLVNGFVVGAQAGLTNLVFGLAFIDRGRQVGGLLRAAAPHASAHDEAVHDDADRRRDADAGG